ncbi:MAG TPA: Ig-like domain-containing domain [Bacteroidales bacterium]|nr:Ig-like domain-containing domain [Bacteroidales bacterium]
MKKGFIIAGFLTGTIVLFIIGCAQQASPTGGPIDEDPPEVLKTDPANYSTQFDAKRIEIDFNEYLDMGNFQTELVVSPPMEEQPLVKLRNKTLIIEFEEELKGDATYTFNFGEGIADLNERNVLLNYEYVFSTGENLDSLSVRGTLKNAFDLSVPESPIYVMLYTALNDSLPLTEIPYYIGRTDEEGNFAVNNLRKGVYKLFVLKDGNSNFLFDLPNERVAFLDSSLKVDGEYFRELLFESGMADSSDLMPDTLSLNVDTTEMDADSISFYLDSLQVVKDSLEQLRPDFNAIYVDLYMFSEAPLNRYISDYKRESRENMEITFNIPLTDTFQFSPVFPDTLHSYHLISDFNESRDVLTIWTADTLVAALDSIGLAMRYTSVDTLDRFISVYDTLMFTYREINENTEKSGDSNQPIKVNTVNNKGKQHFHRPLTFTLENPVKNVDPALFEFYVIPDTTEIPVTVLPFKDSNSLHKVLIDRSWKEEENYRMVLYPGALTDLYGGTNDTIDRKFSVKAISEYGRLVLNIEGVSDTIIIQVMKGESIIRKQVIGSSGTYEFEFLDPATYKVKLVHDSNGNEKWDSGRYIEGLQPERVEFLPEEIDLRANWDHEFTYVIGSNDSPPGSSDDPENSSEEAPLF